MFKKYQKKLYKEAGNDDIFILIMGDKDFVPPVKSIREEHCKAVIAFWNNASEELIAEADEYIDLSDRIDEISYKK